MNRARAALMGRFLIVPFVALLLAAFAHAQTSPPPELPSGWSAKNIVFTHEDMVAAANPLAVQAGVEILGAGGSAVDAAIAVQMVLNLVEPQSSGIGGGAFMLTYTASTGAVEMYDGRETAPMTATERLFLNPDGTPMGFTQAQIGGRSVGTPGVLRLLELAHREKGRLPWATLFEPAIRLAESGFAISPRLFSALQGANTVLSTDPVTGPYFYNADRTPKAVGTILRNPELANTLRTIAANGADAFYTGPIAQDIVNKVKSHPTNPGLLELADLAAYQATKRAPVCDTYRARWEIMGAAVDRHLPNSTTIPSFGGTSFWIRGPEWLDSEVLAKECLGHGILIEPGRIYFGSPERPRNCFRLGFSSIDERKIEPGIKLLAEIIGQSERRSSGIVHAVSGSC